MKQFICATAFACLVATGPALASTITYTASGTATGTIGTNFFAGDSYSITATGDTATAQLCQGPGPIPGCHIVLLSNMQIALGGLGTYTVTSPTVFFDNTNGGLIGFLEAGGPLNFVYYGVGAPAFSTYDGISSVGPLGFYALTQGIVPGNSGPVHTTGGLLTFAPGFAPATFQAVLTTSVVPEPAAWATMTLGFGLLGAAVRGRTSARRRAIAAA